MIHQNSAVINLRKCYRGGTTKAELNGYRNIVFLPGAGRYKGTWKNNIREGLGTSISKNGEIYEGHWKNDKRHGYGLLKRKLQSNKRVYYEPIYDGQWVLDKRHGDGTAYYENGIYEGQWVDNRREGLGIMSFYDGSYYMGEWKNNCYDGVGAHYDVRGTFYKGYFRNGIKSGEGSLHYLVKGEIQKGIWIDGSCVTSILQNISVNNNNLPLGSGIPELRLENPGNVIDESLQSLCDRKEMLKSRQRRIEHFNRL